MKSGHATYQNAANRVVNCNVFVIAVDIGGGGVCGNIERGGGAMRYWCSVSNNFNCLHSVSFCFRFLSFMFDYLSRNFSNPFSNMFVYFRLVSKSFEKEFSKHLSRSRKPCSHWTLFGSG